MIDVELICEISIRGACLEEELSHLLPALIPPLPVGLLNQEFALTPGSDGNWSVRRFIRSAGSDCMGEQTMVRSKGMPQDFAQVAQQVPAISDLYGSGSGPACGFSIDPTAVAADDLTAGMPPQPRSYSVGVAVGKQVDHSAGLQIAQDGSIAMSLAPCPVVNREHTRSLNRRREPMMMKLAQQRRPARQQTQTLSKASTSAALRLTGNSVDYSGPPYPAPVR